jgi:hypothetical protein
MVSCGSPNPECLKLVQKSTLSFKKQPLLLTTELSKGGDQDPCIKTAHEPLDMGKCCPLQLSSSSFVVQDIEPRALCMLGKCFTTWDVRTRMHKTLFLFCGTGIWTQGLLNKHLDMPPVLHLVFKTEVSLTLPRLASNFRSSCLLSAGITGIYHPAQLMLYFKCLVSFA